VWVAIDFRERIWVGILKKLRTTGVYHGLGRSTPCFCRCWETYSNGYRRVSHPLVLVPDKKTEFIIRCPFSDKQLKGNRPRNSTGPENVDDVTVSIGQSTRREGEIRVTSESYRVRQIPPAHDFFLRVPQGPCVSTLSLNFENSKRGDNRESCCFPVWNYP